MNLEHATYGIGFSYFLCFWISVRAFCYYIILCVFCCSSCITILCNLSVTIFLWLYPREYSIFRISPLFSHKKRNNLLIPFVALFVVLNCGSNAFYFIAFYLLVMQNTDCGISNLHNVILIMLWVTLCKATHLIAHCFMCEKEGFFILL